MSYLNVGSRPGLEGSGQRVEWVDPTRSEDTPVQEVGALKKRLVATERDRKQALAEAAAENRALQLQLQVLTTANMVLLVLLLLLGLQGNCPLPSGYGF